MKETVKYILEAPIKSAQNIINFDYDIIGLKIEEETDKKILTRLLPDIKKPVMLRCTGDDEKDKKLLPEFIKLLDRESIIAYANENTYKSILPSVINGKHKLVIRTPIDINLAKEMNILVLDQGLSLNKIIIDTDIGGLGYGFEYGYSIMEKIRSEGANDKYLSLPLISFASEETAKTKEARDEKSALFLEISSAAGVKAAGANYIVLTKPEALKTMKELE